MTRRVILQVLHTLQIGGAEVLAARLARQLRNHYHFAFACLDDLGSLGEELRGEGFSCEVLRRKRGFDLSCVRELAQCAQRHSAGLIHAHQYTPFFYSRAPGWMGRRPPVLFTEHGRFHPDLPNRKRMMFNRLFLRPVDRVVAVGESVKQALINNEGISGNRIEVVYNGVRIDDFTADATARERVRRQLDLGAHDPVAIQVARLDGIKDHLTALRVVERLRVRLPEFQLLLVGKGPERETIEREVKQRQLESHVRCLGERRDIRELLSAADVFLLTSVSEGIPVTLIEAMAARLPVVSTAVGGVEEVVVHGQTGLLAPAKDDEQLANLMLRMIADPCRAKALASAGALRAQRLFSEERMHESYAALFDEMLAQGCARRSRPLAEASI